MPTRAKYMRRRLIHSPSSLHAREMHTGNARRGEVLHMHASIDMNASLHAKRLRAYLILPFSFRPRKASARGCGGGADAETLRVNLRLSSLVRRLLASYRTMCRGSCLALPSILVPAKNSRIAR